MIENWQEWVVLVILLGCLFYLLNKIKTIFRRARKNENPCEGCASNCELKHQVQTKRSLDTSSSCCDDKKCNR